ncbi:hypothetical protein NL676_035548 [Syzygium grande]|nr:hypothetical protein NL676_035548 [Syzygium grande]
MSIYSIQPEITTVGSSWLNRQIHGTVSVNAERSPSRSRFALVESDGASQTRTCLQSKIDDLLQELARENIRRIFVFIAAALVTPFGQFASKRPPCDRPDPARYRHRTRRPTMVPSLPPMAPDSSTGHESSDSARPRLLRAASSVPPRGSSPRAFRAVLRRDGLPPDFAASRPANVGLGPAIKDPRN